ncbi:MAG: hypothetical protein HY661_13380 [Betaproteobacteria bacterium]|nr:hypothetical protein [Betaproteobacteria bacterium]
MNRGTPPHAHHRTGRLRLVGVFHDRRARTAPDIPTAIESGMLDIHARLFSAIFAPAGTAPRTIDALYQASAKAMAGGGLRKDLETAGADVALDFTPEKTTRFIQDEIALWTPVIRASGFRPD